MTPDIQQRHVEILARDLGTEVRQAPNMPGMMYVEYRPPMIEGPTIQHQYDYMVMLHELGHVYHGHTQGRPPFNDEKHYFDNGVLRSEAEAWEYALDASEEDEYTEETRVYMWRRCIGSYLESALMSGGRPGQQLWNGNRHWVRFAYDVPDNYFWRVAERLAGHELTEERERAEMLGFKAAV